MEISSLKLVAKQFWSTVKNMSKFILTPSVGHWSSVAKLAKCRIAGFTHLREHWRTQICSFVVFLHFRCQKITMEKLTTECSVLSRTIPIKTTLPSTHPIQNEKKITFVVWEMEV